MPAWSRPCRCASGNARLSPRHTCSGWRRSRRHGPTRRRSRNSMHSIGIFSTPGKHRDGMGEVRNMSKFNKPKPTAAVVQADIDRVIEGADAVDDRREGKPAEDVDDGEVRFTMTLTGDLARR